MTADPARAPLHRLWRLADAQAYLPALDRMFDSIDRAVAEATPASRVDAPVLYHGLLAVLGEEGILVRDISNRLIDFRARAANGTVILLCRTRDEDEIAYWHPPETGYAGRRSLRDDPPW